MNNWEQMYPDAYARLYPHIHNVVNTLSDEQLDRMTHADISGLAQTAMARSNMVNDPPSGHNRDTLNDIATALILGGLIGRRRGFLPFLPFYQYPYSPFYPPFLGGGHRGGHGGRHRR